VIIRDKIDEVYQLKGKKNSELKLRQLLEWARKFFV
jgi:hypothetical protein